MELMKRAIKDPRGFGNQTVEITDEMLKMLAAFANGDARNGAGNAGDGRFERAPRGQQDDRDDGDAGAVHQPQVAFVHDKTGEEHYNIISALHKSMRNSDRTRRFTGFRVCWRRAKTRCMWRGGSFGSRARTWAWRTAAHWRSPWRRIRRDHFIGMRRCSVNLTHAVVYLSMAPKSNALYVAYESAKRDAQKMLSERCRSSSATRQQTYGRSCITARVRICARYGGKS